MSTFYDSVFNSKQSKDDLALIALSGARDISKKIDHYLVKWFNEEQIAKNSNERKETTLLATDCPRFNTGDAKGIIYETVREKDVFILCDVANYSIKYNMYGIEQRMSPDDHFTDLKRIISAMAGKPRKITVIMPLLYGGRQHRRNTRESLDCAQMLHELYAMGVTGIITFDAHDPRVQNSIPLMGFDNFLPTYQILKALIKRYPDIKLDKKNFMMVSPDEGAMRRNIYYSSVLGVDLGMFYKRRDYSVLVEGSNPIVAHEYIGNSPRNKSVLVVDDIIATGGSVLRLCKSLKERKVKDIHLATTYPLFTQGVTKFDDAYKEGLFTSVIGTNLAYVPEKVKEKEWFVEADMSKFLAYIIFACHKEQSLSEFLDPHDKIKFFIDKWEKSKSKK